MARVKDGGLAAQIARASEDAAFRAALAFASHYWFFLLYLGAYATAPLAEMHREMFAMTERATRGVHVLVAFRGSGKSTICTLSLVLWAILGAPRRKFVIVLSQTQRQARQHLQNIREELERNELLRRDLGPFREESNEWGGMSLVLPALGARITAASREQSVRGLRHRQHRPDLVVADDVEDLAATRTQEARDATYGWLKGDVLPAMGPSGAAVLVGNLLHEDALLPRLRREIESGALAGSYREYPIADAEGNPTWPGRHPDRAALAEARRALGDDRAWSREFELRIQPEADQVVPSEWIRFYEGGMPAVTGDKYSWTRTAIDLAISQSASADKTAMVTGSLFGRYGDRILYIHPNPVNARLTFPDGVRLAAKISRESAAPKRGGLLVEDVAYQASFKQMLWELGVDATGVRPGALDKRARLALVSKHIESGAVRFPPTGCEDLIEQLVGFGSERHDDLVDALVMLIAHAFGPGSAGPTCGGKMAM